MHLDPGLGSVAAAFVGLATTTSVASFPSVTIVAVIATIIGIIIIIIIIIIIAVAIELVLHRLPAVPADA